LRGSEGAVRGRVVGATDSSVFRMPKGLPKRRTPSEKVATQGGRTFYPNDPAIKAKYPRGVAYTIQGYPDFTTYAKMQVRIKMRGDYYHDYKAANQAAGFGDTVDLPPHLRNDWVWHHHHARTTMQLVPRDLHYALRHHGGVQVIGEQGPLP